MMRTIRIVFFSKEISTIRISSSPLRIKIPLRCIMLSSEQTVRLIFKSFIRKGFPPARYTTELMSKMKNSNIYIYGALSKLVTIAHGGKTQFNRTITSA